MAQVQCYMEYGNFESGSELDPLDDLWVVKLLSYLQAGRDVQAEELEFEGESHKILDSNYSKNLIHFPFFQRKNACFTLCWNHFHLVMTLTSPVPRWILWKLRRPEWSDCLFVAGTASKST